MPTLLTVVVLRELARIPPGWSTTNELLQRVREEAADPGVVGFWVRDLPGDRFLTPWPSSLMEALEWSLNQLAEAGILQRDKYGPDGQLRWRLRPGWPGDGGDGDGGDRRELGDGDGEGGGGIGEVLAHPFLFALSEADFDEALLRATGEGQ